MAEMRTKEGLVVGLIEPTANAPQDKTPEEKPQEATARKSTRGKKNDAE